MLLENKKEDGIRREAGFLVDKKTNVKNARSAKKYECQYIVYKRIFITKTVNVKINGR